MLLVGDPAVPAARQGRSCGVQGSATALAAEGTPWRGPWATLAFCCVFTAVTMPHSGRPLCHLPGQKRLQSVACLIEISLCEKPIDPACLGLEQPPPAVCVRPSTGCGMIGSQAGPGNGQLSMGSSRRGLVLLRCHDVRRESQGTALSRCHQTQ